MKKLLLISISMLTLAGLVACGDSKAQLMDNTEMSYYPGQVNLVEEQDPDEVTYNNSNDNSTLSQVLNSEVKPEIPEEPAEEFTACNVPSKKACISDFTNEAICSGYDGTLVVECPSKPEETCESPMTQTTANFYKGFDTVNKAVLCGEITMPQL